MLKIYIQKINRKKIIQVTISRLRTLLYYCLECILILLIKILSWINWLIDFFLWGGLDDCLIVQLPHIEQDASWDCGLACIQMVLPEDLATKFKQNLSTICPEEYHNQRLLSN